MPPLPGFVFQGFPLVDSLSCGRCQAATAHAADSSGIADALARLKVYVLLPDVEARGMAGKLAEGIHTVGYDGFVDLVAEHPNNQSWL